MDKYEELEKLQNLKTAGSLTEEEFEVEKKKILGTEKSDENKSNKFSTAGFVLGIISFLISGLITGIIGIVFSAKAKHQAKQEGRKDEKAVVGLVLSIIGVVKAILAIALVSLFFLLAITSESFYTEKEYKYENTPNHRIERHYDLDNGQLDIMFDEFFNN